MFKRIAIDNYRCFSNFEFRPDRMNLLLGPNGAGKSSLFDLVRSVLGLIRWGADVSDVFPSASLTRWDRRDRQRIELEVEGNGSTYNYVLVIRHDAQKERSAIERETVTSDGRVLFAFEDGMVHLHNNDGKEGASFAFRGNRSFLAQIEDRPATKVLMWLLHFLDGVKVLRINARSMSGTSAVEEPVLALDGANFASWYRHLNQEMPDRLQTLRTALEPVVPGFQTLKIPSTGGHGRARDLVVAMTTAGASYDVDFDELSDGQRALIVLYTLLQAIEPGQGCLLLDEPEAHVGLAEVQPWLVELDGRFEDRGQFFVASHHPEVVDYLAASNAWLFERADGGPVVVRTRSFDSECGLSASKQISRGIGGAG